VPHSNAIQNTRYRVTPATPSRRSSFHAFATTLDATSFFSPSRYFRQLLLPLRHASAADDSAAAKRYFADAADAAVLPLLPLMPRRYAARYARLYVISLMLSA